MGNMLHHLIDFRSIYKGHLQAHNIAADGREHVAAAYQLIGTTGIQDGSAVNLAGNFKSNPGGEVGFDGTGYDVDAGSLGGDDTMQSTALASWAILAMGISTSLPAVMIRSANSSITSTI